MPFFREQKKNIFLILIGGLLFVGAILANEVYIPHASFEGKKHIEIPQGFGSRKIGALLRDEGAIRSKWAFVTYVSLRQESTQLKPGEYTFFSDMDIREISSDLLRGGSTEVIITVPEGWTMADIAKYLEEEKMSSPEEFFSVAGYPTIDYRINNKLPSPTHFSGTYSFLSDKPWYVGLEGYLFPDTYRVFRDSTPSEIIGKMLENLDKKLTPDLREEIARQKKTIFEIVIIASLIEKEVRSEEDRAIVSGILWKRLSRNIPLQIDATINYITGGKSPSVSIEETKINSPYNTYLYPGLPLGPITNPGISAIRAAVYPKITPYLFYLSTPDGTTIFSRTLDEHNAAKRKYLTN